MKGVLLFCTVLQTFWYSQDTQTVCLLIFKNKYYDGKRNTVWSLSNIISLNKELPSDIFLKSCKWISLPLSVMNSL